MGAILAIGIISTWFAAVGLAVTAVWLIRALIRAIVRKVQHEMIMYPKARYYVCK